MFQYFIAENLLQGSIATDKDSRSSFQDRPPDKPRESVIRFDPSVDEDEYCSDDDDPDKVTHMSRKSSLFFKF